MRKLLTTRKQKLIIKRFCFLELLRTIYGGNAKFICGYEAGCLGFTLYHQMTSQHVECIILASTTMLEQRSKKRIKTDKRDAVIIAKCLA